MKKILFFFLALTFIGCENSDLSPTTQQLNVKQIDADLKIINSNYSSDSQLQNRPFKSWCLIFSSDVAGAWAGAWAGGKIGAVFGQQGAGAGAVVGGVVVGAAASYGVSRTAPPIDRSRSDALIANYNPLVTYNTPSLNPFDISVGQKHNILLKELVLNNPAIGNNAEHIYANVALSSDERIFYDNQKQLVSEWYSQMSTSNSIATQKSLLSSTVDDALVLSVMTNYLDGTENINTLDEGISLTRAYENYVLSSTLSSTQKDYLLRGLSVARYSLNFWNINN